MISSDRSYKRTGPTGHIRKPSAKVVEAISGKHPSNTGIISSRYFILLSFYY